MVKVRKDLSKQEFGMLTVIEQTEDYVVPTSGQHQAMWLCRCQCGNVLPVRASTLKNNTSLSCGCIRNKRKRKSNKNNTKIKKHMTEQEKEDWDELYNFVKNKVLMYDENQSLSKTMVLRLKGLLSNKFIANNNIEDTANYSYQTILNTFKFCLMDIERGLSNKSFSNEIHKFNYALKIVESNINTVYMRMKQNKKTKEEIKDLDMSNATTNASGVYQRKTVDDVSNKFDDFW